ncbi:nucleotide sugar dehydrogenase [Thermopetrobacter sp. TC1]|uniref:nucleotide sugar dehydrogenase n=1 Tax=Thermopetrobacter sp. TC1 TaxID=1495045 RepID=UPI000571BD4F|nr:nucleotide sugar dehydrogenase [Thermopetrobacter sp. TC1]
MNYKTSLIAKLKEKRARIGILGMGYVGLPLALAYVEEGFDVLGFDIDAKKVAALNAGESYIRHIGTDRVKRAADSGRLTATDDFSRAQEADALILCVPTPLDVHREPDLSFVTSTLEAILPHLRPGQVVSLESTTWPGTTEEVIRPPIEARGLHVGEEIFVVYSPEREDPGNPRFGTRDIPKVLGGSTPACRDVGIALYEQVVVEVVPVSSTQAAEMTKLLENIHRAVNIGLVNEMKIVADRMGLDIHEIIRAAATKPFGFVPYWPGPGLGGHCIPIDPFYLTWKAREYGVHTRFIELAGEINSSMPDFVISKVMLALNERGRAVNGARILVLGIAYKKNVDDMRESPSVVLMQKLMELGARVDYSDPHVPVFPPLRRAHFDLKSVPLTPDSVRSYDCLLLATDHDAFDYDMILENAALIVDTRGRYPGRHDNVVKA